MCRNIKTLANFAPPATDDEIRASALQFVRKLSGATKPSKANEAVFNQAVEEVTEAAQRLVRSLVTTAPPRTREEEARKARERARARYGGMAVLLLCVCLAGCASIRNGRTQSVEVSSLPAGARVVVDGVPGAVTPTVLELPRKAKAVEVRLEMAGYDAERIVLSRRASRWVMGNAGLFAPLLLNQGFSSYGPVLLGYLVAVAASMGIDFMNGSAYEQVPERVHIALTRSPSTPD